MTTEVIGFTTVFGLFIVIPSLVVTGLVAGRWLKVRTMELQLRREELELQRRKLEFLITDRQLDEGRRD